MSKHVINPPRAASTERFGQFPRIARAEAAIPIQAGLARRKRLDAVARLSTYPRIARQKGQTTLAGGGISVMPEPKAMT